ncbi:hypothetical protein PoB_001159500 [Plakobranchus ocellatus]|uniref:Uncharacterized protein n=1 Tax=Plakobranchus ocellatus TaxID=259542 RepID=A0AAV3YRM4_9GAST|nr:hypothetical protein PoB_001159500 [Plakobranchus ocellatus]
MVGDNLSKEVGPRCVRPLKSRADNNQTWARHLLYLIPGIDTVIDLDICNYTGWPLVCWSRTGRMTWSKLAGGQEEKKMPCDMTNVTSECNCRMSTILEIGVVYENRLCYLLIFIDINLVA